MRSHGHVPISLALDQPMTLDDASAATLHAGRDDAASDHEKRGAVFTRREVVEFILDLVGYTADRDLAGTRLLEPAAGHGHFLIPAVERLVVADRAHGGDPRSLVERLGAAIVAVEVHDDSAEAACAAIRATLRRLDVADPAAAALARRWVVRGDFLLLDQPSTFTHAVGNPPYVRQEQIPDELLAAYRTRYATMYDRADLYVPFFERALSLLAPGGQLGFICTDRWMKNRYGGPLRALVAQRFLLRTLVDLTGTSAFHDEVATYPAITVIERPAGSAHGVETRVAIRPAIHGPTLRALAEAITAPVMPQGAAVVSMAGVVRGSEPWVVHLPDRLALVRRLEAGLPTLEEAGCRIGIGVATGADSVFIQPFGTLDVEPERKIRLVRTCDIAHGEVDWQGMGVLNPFELDGRLAELGRYPRFAAYLRRHEARLRARHVARRHDAGWYRTIDRIDPGLAATPKLLVPDIKGDAHIVFEPGRFYPHHNLYWITASDWDLRALEAVLMSGIARLFVATYSTTMRGGWLRFQAQFLRRIRVPPWESVPVALRRSLRAAAVRRDMASAADATARLYGLSPAERTLLNATLANQSHIPVPTALPALQAV